jgi:ubiquitin carboxyl-terminal hydrolase 8
MSSTICILFMTEYINKNKGFTGILNLGNTCFLNTCIQCLNHTYELHDILNQKKSKANSENTVLTNEWIDLTKMMWEQNGIISPVRFVNAVHHVALMKNKTLFTEYSQNDICEFLLFLVDCMHESICRKVKMNITGNTENIMDKMAVESYRLLKTIYEKEYSEIMELFYGVYVTTILDETEKTNISMRAEHFFILDLQLFGMNDIYRNIYDCFEVFSELEHMHGENAWLNEKTNTKENVIKVNVFWSLPDILVLCLKRFSPDGNRKLQHLVDFPMEGLDLCKYVKGYNSKSYIYDLYGVCNHTGGVQGGHYYAFVKHISGKWLHFNDTEVHDCTSEIVTPYAYCLFYRKRKC